MKFTVLVMAVGLALSACGKGPVFDPQKDQREDVLPELRGNWVSLCEANQILRLAFEGNTLRITQNKYYDAECTDPKRTLTNHGTFDLAHNFKEGILNGIVYKSDLEFEVALNSESERDEANNDLAKIQNEKESEILPGAKVDERRRITRANQQIRWAKRVELWRIDTNQALNRLQTEKLNAYGLGETPIVDFGTRAVFRYELDNGYLQVNAPKIGQRVYTRE